MNQKVALIILDGWGIGQQDLSDAIAQAQTPFTQSLTQKYPHATLRTDGENVGLPEGQMGNSEVGHMNIGAGRVVYQDLVKIHKSIRDGEFEQLPTLVHAFEHAEKAGKKVHLLGLVSDGGVHSHLDHLIALCRIAKRFPTVSTCIHAILDGRDTDPKSGINYMREIQEKIAETPAQVATIIGRYYAMDRDKRWERVKKAYDLLVEAKGAMVDNAQDAIEASYRNSITDEFVEPIVIQGINGKIESGDTVICFNFRTDRCREITMALTQQSFPDQEMHPIPSLHYVTMARYDDTFKNVHVVYEKDNLQHTLGEVLSSAGKSQLRMAETEKYPHVTFFFNGGREAPFEQESRKMVASPKVATYDLQPEMSAFEVKDMVIEDMRSHTPDFICLNFANPDMVGHTGVFSAIVKAVETVDQCLKEVVLAGQTLGYEFIVIADHGNADMAVNADGSPNTAHTTNPVPVWLISERFSQLNHGILADVAPTVLKLMDVPQPPAMTGKSLVE
jgi:2,3-bisphosphoglycerate-independent phosphoglycerate mutase